MPDAKDRRAWAAQEVALEKHGFAEWEREEVRRRLDSDGPLLDMFTELGGSERAAVVLRQFMLFCLPPKGYGDTRRFKSGFYRMVAFAWRVAPELIEGCMTHKDVADRLGMSERAFLKHILIVDGLLGRDTDPRSSAQNPGGVKTVKFVKSRVLPAPGRQ